MVTTNDMQTLIIFAALSIPVIILSRKTLFNFRSHGFYRFWSWECLIWLLASNYRFWFTDPLSLQQICSWFLLFVSIYPVVAGTIQLRKKGKPTLGREDKELFKFEKTSALVDSGIYHYIRHPLYASLILLTWGILLKNITFALSFVALLSTIFLYMAALFDEKECIRYFGEPYRIYMNRSKRFIPYLI